MLVAPWQLWSSVSADSVVLIFDTDEGSKLRKPVPQLFSEELVTRPTGFSPGILEKIWSSSG